MIQQLKSDGSTDVQLPQFPKSELSQILNGGIVRENKQILRGTDLDEYLRKHLVEVHVNVTDSLQLLALDIGNIDRNTPITDVISNIKKGLNVCNRNNARLLESSLVLGSCLNKAFKIFQFQKGAGNINVTWSDFLSKSVGISPSYARQLREIAKNFFIYKKFSSLGMSFSEFYKRRLQIQHLLDSSDCVKAFWMIP